MYFVALLLICALVNTEETSPAFNLALSANGDVYWLPLNNPDVINAAIATKHADVTVNKTQHKPFVQRLLNLVGPPTDWTWYDVHVAVTLSLIAFCGLTCFAICFVGCLSYCFPDNARGQFDVERHYRNVHPISYRQVEYRNDSTDHEEFDANPERLLPLISRILENPQVQSIVGATIVNYAANNPPSSRSTSTNSLNVTDSSTQTLPALSKTLETNY